MKSFGLEGKVGAPAIVKENLLLAMYDRFCRDNAHRFIIDSIWRPALIAARPFTWRDTLDVVRERYVGAEDTTLSEFITAAIRVLPDPVLTYDLETPELKFSVSRQSMKGLGHPSPVIRYDPHIRSLAAAPADPEFDITPGNRPCDMGRVIHLVGTCANLYVFRNIALIDGFVRTTQVDDGLCVLRGDVERLVLCNDTFGAILPGGRVTTESYADGVLLSAVKLDYYTVPDILAGGVCDPDMNGRSRALYGHIVRCADNPDQLLLTNAQIRDDANRISRNVRAHQNRRQLHCQDPVAHHPSAGLLIPQVHYHFTPRGAR